MDNYEGDLTDILRASGGVIEGDTSTTIIATTSTNLQQQMPAAWRFGSSSKPDLLQFSDVNGSPFRGQLGHVDPGGAGCSNGGSATSVQNYSPSNNSIFSRAVQILPYSSSNNNTGNTNNSSIISSSRNNSVIKAAYGLMSNEMISINNNASSSSCMSSSGKDGFLDSGVQIPSPRNPGIKRRKCQAKKVVCIPAPPAANNRQGGEIVPSDLWAWRKYGQKPIKGSPYPRGYYRCSSSKGCSARKQVERSRTDPKMLVITYTSEHNHPWPTQRNALAGLARSQPSKQTSKPSSEDLTEEANEKEKSQENDGEKKPSLKRSRSSLSASSIKVEETRMDQNQEDNKVDDTLKAHEEGASLSQSYRPVFNEPCSEQKQEQSDQHNFFSDLGFEGDDPLNLLFTQESKALDSFSGFFDWADTK